jgi:hypothetical protein
MGLMETKIDSEQRNPLEDLDALKAERQQPPDVQPKAKAKKGRPKKKPEPAPEPEPAPIIDPAMTKQAMAVVFAIIAKRSGEHWNLSDEELENGALCFDALANKYFPMLGPYMVELNCLIWVSMVIGPRFYITLEIAKAEKEAKRKAVLADETPTK